MITDFVWTESIISSPHFTFRRGITAHSNGIGGCHNIYSFLGVSPRSAYDRGPCEWWVQVVASAHVYSCISFFLPSTSTHHTVLAIPKERKQKKQWRAAWSNNWPKFVDTRQLIMGAKTNCFCDHHPRTVYVEMDLHDLWTLCALSESQNIFCYLNLKRTVAIMFVSERERWTMAVEKNLHFVRALSFYLFQKPIRQESCD